MSLLVALAQACVTIRSLQPVQTSNHHHTQMSRYHKRQYWRENWRRILGPWALALGCFGFGILPLLLAGNETAENNGKAEIKKVVRQETSKVKADLEYTPVRYPRSRPKVGTSDDLAQK